MLVTSAIAGQTSFLANGPKLPGFSQAAAASAARTGVRLAAAGQVRTVALGAQALVVGLAPTAVAAVAMEPGGNGEQAPQTAPSQPAGDTANVRSPATRHYAKQVDQRTLANGRGVCGRRRAPMSQ